jgi:AraC-like DNA-binding protein
MGSSDAPSADTQTEHIRILRQGALPGLELLEVTNSLRAWKVFNTVHSVTISESWLGEVTYRGRVSEITPGSVFCTEPGEAHATSRPAAAGALHVLMIEEAPLREQLAELDFHARDIRFTEIVTRQVAPELRRLARLLGAAGRTPLELQSGFVELVEAMSQHLITADAAHAAKIDADDVADSMRDLLHAGVEDGVSLSLDELAAAAKLGKFRALRAFKRRHGIPPHTYELCLRLGRARALIKSGMSLAATAMECGFADQSHMTRHFRAFHGYTPARCRDAESESGEDAP